MSFITLPIQGKTLVAIEGSKDSDQLIFTTSDGEMYRMWHSQSCCENVSIEDIAGEFADLLDTPLLLAEERSSTDPAPGRAHNDDSGTWTYYQLATINGAVSIRWYGSSNGYYSESVSFEKIDG